MITMENKLIISHYHVHIYEGLPVEGVHFQPHPSIETHFRLTSYRGSFPPHLLSGRPFVVCNHVPLYAAHSSAFSLSPKGREN